MINIKNFGITYTVVDREKNFTDMQIIFLDAFLDEVGTIEYEDMKNYRPYLENVFERLEGFYPSLYDVTWYSRSEEESDIVEAVKEAMREGNNAVIIEYIPKD